MSGSCDDCRHLDLPSCPYDDEDGEWREDCEYFAEEGDE
jgi:hypothetical protein